MNSSLSDPSRGRAVSAVSRGVLIVDDEPMILTLLERSCALSGLQTYLAASGEEAVEIYRRQGDSIGVVLLDVRMPGMSGPATLDALRRLNPDVRCCFMSGDRSDWAAEELLGRGALHLFNKPLPLRELIATLRDAVALREFTDRLQSLTHQLLNVQEEERRHLARELHDEFGQLLATITLHLHAARGLAGEAALPRLDECVQLLQQAGEQVRSLALDLRPPMLDTLGLEASLHWLAEHHQQRTGCEVQLVGHLSGAPLSPEMAIAYFRVAQETLTNVVRHSAAPHVWIELSQSASVLELVVRDDGVGFDVVAIQEQASRRGSLGLLGMRERVKILGGSLQVESEPGRGTCIRASFPPGKVSEQPGEPEE